MTTFLALLTGGGLAAIGGLLSGLVANWLGERRDQRKYEHERVMALEARRQQRLEQAYVELLGYLAHHAAWARSVQALFDVKAPDPLADENVKRIEALVTAYGSDEVRQLLVQWIERGGKLAQASAVINTERESANPSQELQDEAHRELRAIPSYRDAILDVDSAIRERVRRELTGEA
jgi:hypothetical protein